MISVQSGIGRYGFILGIALSLSFLSTAAQAYTPEQQQACSRRCVPALRSRDTGRRPRYGLHDQEQVAAQPRLPGVFPVAGAGAGGNVGRDTKTRSPHARHRAKTR